MQFVSAELARQHLAKVADAGCGDKTIEKSCLTWPVALIAPEELWRVKHIAFARKLLKLLPAHDGVLLIDEWGIWPSSEDRTVVVALKQFWGHASKVENENEYSVIFQSADISSIATYLSVILDFGWGGLLRFDALNWFKFSHDGWAHLRSKESEPEVADLLDGFGLKFKWVREESALR